MEAFPRSKDCRRLRQRFGRFWGAGPRSAMPLIGQSISAIIRRTVRGMFISTLIRYGPTTISISSALTITCPCRTGAMARIIWMPIGGRSMTPIIWRRISKGARGSTGFITRTKRAMRRSGPGLKMWITVRIGSGATRTFAAGGRPITTIGSRGSGLRRRRAGCPDQSRSDSRNWVARPSTRARTSPTSFLTRNHRNPRSRIIRAGIGTRPFNASISRRC